MPEKNSSHTWISVSEVVNLLGNSNNLKIKLNFKSKLHF